MPSHLDYHMEGKYGMVVQDVLRFVDIRNTLPDIMFINAIKDANINELKYLSAEVFYKNNKVLFSHTEWKTVINYAQNFLQYWNIDTEITVEEILNNKMFYFELETQGITIQVRTINFLDFYDVENDRYFKGFENITGDSPRFSWWHRYIAGLKHRYVTFYQLKL